MRRVADWHLACKTVPQAGDVHRPHSGDRVNQVETFMLGISATTGVLANSAAASNRPFIANPPN
jgi:hypothetical protein